MKLKQAFFIASLLGAHQAVQAWGFFGCDIFPDTIYRSQKDFTTILEAVKNKTLPSLKSSDWENGKNAQLAGFDFNIVTPSLQGINLSNAHLYQTNFLGVDLTSANLSHATLTSAWFYSTNLTNANLQHATIYKDPSDTLYLEFLGATIEGACVAGIKEYKEMFKYATGTPLTTFKACKEAGFEVNPKDLEKETQEAEKRNARLAAQYKQYQESVNKGNYYKSR